MANSAPARNPLANPMLIRGGLIIDHRGRRLSDILIQDEAISQIGVSIDAPGAQLIDASNLIILPGGIDPHVHLSYPTASPYEASWADDFTSGSQAAFAGGVTTIGNISFPKEDERPFDTFLREKRLAQITSIADVLIHPVIENPNPDFLPDLTNLFEAGCRTIKLFMTPASFDSNAVNFIRFIEESGRLGILPMIHCEDSAIMNYCKSKLAAAGTIRLTHYAESRPVISEITAVQRAIAFGEVAQSPIYIVHLSSRRALAACQAAKQRGQKIYIETRPLYLHFTQEKYHTPLGPTFVGQPPLREKDDMESLWQGIFDETIDVLASDHAPWTLEQKLDPSHSILNLRPGVSNLEFMGPVFFSEGVIQRNLSLEKFVALTSTNAAKIFGLFPKKGAIQPGSDADLTIWDPNLTKTIDRSMSVSKAGFSVFEGMTATGWPRMTIRRGVVVYRDGVFTGFPGDGRFAHPSPP